MPNNLIKPYNSTSLLSYFLNAVITARLETGLLSNTIKLDEDVNIYLAGMLQKFSSGLYADNKKQIKPLLESELVFELEKTFDMRARYNLYKENAELIMFNIAIMNGVEKKKSRINKWFSLGEDAYISRCKSYFYQAASYGRKCGKKETNIAPTLDKVAENFTIYLNLLYHVKEHYFHFEEKFTDGEWFHFVYKNIIQKSGVSSKVYVELMDNFLATLSSWKKSFNNGDKHMLRLMAVELKRLNPDFNYNIEKLFESEKITIAA